MICEFSKLSWPEINDAAESGKVALLPAATLEDHGLHLPVDTDVVIAEAVCRRAAERAGDDTVLLPCVTFGYSPHHIDGPGTLTIRWDTFVNYVRQITGSLAYHGFYKILIVNAHGSNRPVLDLAARLTIVENPDVQCGMLSWWDLKSVREVVAGFRESDWTGHACELETSLYLAIDPGRVNMEAGAPGHQSADEQPLLVGSRRPAACRLFDEGLHDRVLEHGQRNRNLGRSDQRDRREGRGDTRGCG